MSNSIINYHPLINKFFGLLQLRGGGRLDFIRSLGFSRPFITIARDPGSGGKPIAQLLAEKMNFEYVDEQIIDQIAHSIKKRTSIVKRIDEKTRSAIEDIVHSILNKEYIDDSLYIQELVKVILAYAHKGNVVILGRGANFICPFGKGLHVNITASHAVRMQRAMDYEGVDQNKAKEILDKVEKERVEFVRQYFGKNAQSARAYDLTINTAYFDLKQAVELIVAAFKLKFPR